VTRTPSSAHPLLAATRPEFEHGDAAIAAVDLFAGCGGLSLGIAQACHDAGLALDLRLAVDFDARALDVLATNFPKANIVAADIGQALNGNLGDPMTDEESGLLGDVDTTHVLLAGPPCQGHSNLNNHTRREDPKNRLYLRVARAAELLRPSVVLIENVPAVQHDKGHVVSRTLEWLQAAGYRVADQVVRLDQLGVPQRRQRHVLFAVRDVLLIDPAAALAAAVESGDRHNLRWAIGDLAAMTDGTGIDKAPTASPANLARMRWLLDNDEYDLPNALRPKCHQGDHSYVSMYGRLHWDKPAQTLTSGFTSIGQGRYMHPDRPRALTAHEAARIQAFPDYFQFAPLPTRTSLATMIANAVPPELSRRIIRQALLHLPAIANASSPRRVRRATTLRAAEAAGGVEVDDVAADGAGVGATAKEDAALKVGFHGAAG
jgi:DNA (cytosine-5)-methyltransferase 1